MLLVKQVALIKHISHRTKKINFGTISTSREGGLAEGKNADDDVPMDVVWALSGTSKSSTKLDLKMRRALVSQPTTKL